MIAIAADVSGALAGSTEFEEKDLAFLVARFLTMQAKTGQTAAITEEQSGIFQLRNDWTTRNTKITPATKSSLLSEVFTDTENRKSGAPDYLGPQQEGGDKVPHAGHQYLAIPTRYLRKLAPGVIPDALRPKNLLPDGAKLDEDYSGNFRSSTAGARPRRALGRDAKQDAGQR